MRITIRKSAFLTAILLILLLGVTVVLAMGLLNLPGFQVSADQQWVGDGPKENGTLRTTLSGVGAGFDVADGTYPGWCQEDNGQPNQPAGTLVTLYDSTDPASLPATYQGVPWDKVNYLLNHKAGTAADVNQALWLLTGTFSGTFGPVSATAQALYDAANANGGGFVPSSGQVIAVILYGDGLGPDGFQDTIIEVPYDPPPPPPPPGGEGCTPGYWKNHFEDWPPTGYSTGDSFEDVFGIDAPDGYTLGDAIFAKGGGFKKLARHGTAALLSAAHPDVSSPYTVDQVIAFVQAGDADPLVYANELGCEIP